MIHHYTFLWTSPLQPDLDITTSKMGPQMWHCANNPDRGQYQSKVTSALGRGKDNHAQQFDCSSSCGLGQTSGLTAGPTHNESHGTTQEEHFAVWCNQSSGIFQVWHHSSPRWPKTDPLITQGLNPALYQTKRAIANAWTEGSTTTVVYMQHISRNPWSTRLWWIGYIAFQDTTLFLLRTTTFKSRRCNWLSQHGNKPRELVKWGHERIYPK